MCSCSRKSATKRWPLEAASKLDFGQYPAFRLMTSFASASGASLPVPPAARDTAQLPLAVREALGRLFEHEHLANCGLQLHKDRLRQAVTGNVLLEKHHVVALRSLAVETIDDGTAAT